MTTATDSETTEATCPNCRARHFVPTIRLHNGQAITRVLCSSCHEEQGRREAQQRQQRARNQLEAEWQAICPPLYRGTDPARLPAVKLADALAWQYGPQGLLLIGPTATGKTRAAYLLLKRLLDEGLRIVAFDCAAFGHECGRRFRAGDGEDWADSLAKVDVLFLDDVGKIPFTERVEAELFALVERRTANELPIIATTNMTGTDLGAKASADRGAPLVRRLREFCRVIVF